MSRPDGWNKYEQFDISPVSDNLDASLIEIFEAGADAYEKALKGIPGHIISKIGNDNISISFCGMVFGDQKGKWVFIPDEEV